MDQGDAETRNENSALRKRSHREPDPPSVKQNESRQNKEKKLKNREKESSRNQDVNCKMTADKQESKRHRSRTRPGKKETPQAYRDDRDEGRGSNRKSPGFKADSPYSSYSYGYQSPTYNQFSSYSKRSSPNSTSYYGRDTELISGYSVSKSPANKRKRSPSPYAWRRSQSPYEQWESTASPYSRRRSRSPYRKSVSPSPELR